VSRLRWALLVAALAAAAIAYSAHTRDPRMRHDLAARALQERLHTEWPFACKPQENDGTISLTDVDYACEALGQPAQPGYWIGTDAHRITQIMPMG
jgi:hypothetical protein